MKYHFDNILGHNHIIKSLQSSIQHERVCHAYLFCGADGIGKNLIANTFAKTLLCNANSITPCNDCISCKTFESNNNPDVIYIAAEKKSIGVDEIRDKVVKQMETKPYHYKYKIFIIDDSHLITASAQNALLKTIEEPANYGIFLMLAESEHVFLPTVLSRTIKFKLKPVATNIVNEYLLKNLDINEQDALYYSIFSNGNIGYAQKLSLDSNFMDMRCEVSDLLISIKNFGFSDISHKAKYLEKFKDSSIELLELFELWFRDLLIYRAIGDENLVMQKDLLDNIVTSSESYSVSAIVKNFEFIENAKQELKRYASFQLVMEVLMLNLKH